MSTASTLARLRAELRVLEPTGSGGAGVLPFGLPALDARLPERGLARGALHEVLPGERGPADEAAATLFLAGIAARTEGPVLWCHRQCDLFTPALGQVGLDPARIIHLEAGDEAGLLACLEEALRHGGLAAAVGEVTRLSMKASRRLQLAAEGRATLGLVLQRSNGKGQGRTEPSAAVTRWRVAARPSAPLPVPGVGRAQWEVELLRVRGGQPDVFYLESCDETGYLGLPADLPDGLQAPARQRAAS